MFHWICPECGREIAPTVRECPVCDGGAEQPELVLAGVVEASARTLQPDAPKGDRADIATRRPTADPLAGSSLPELVKWARAIDDRAPAADAPAAPLIRPVQEAVEAASVPPSPVQAVPNEEEPVPAESAEKRLLEKLADAPRTEVSKDALTAEILDSKSAYQRSAEAKAAGIMGLLTRTADAWVRRPGAGEAKPVTTRTVESRSVESRGVEAKPADVRPVESKPIELKPVISEPIESKIVEAAPVLLESVEAKPVETEHIATTPVDATPIEVSSAEKECAADVQPADQFIERNSEDTEEQVEQKSLANAAPSEPEASPTQAADSAFDRIPLLAKLSRLALPKSLPGNESSKHESSGAGPVQDTQDKIETVSISAAPVLPSTPEGEPGMVQAIEVPMEAPPVSTRNSDPKNLDAKHGVKPEAISQEPVLPVFAAPDRESLNALLDAVSMLDEDPEPTQPDPPAAGALPLPISAVHLPAIAPALVSLGAIEPRALTIPTRPATESVDKFVTGNLVNGVVSPETSHEHKLGLANEPLALQRPSAQPLTSAARQEPVPQAPRAGSVRTPHSRAPFLAPNTAGLAKYDPLENRPIRATAPPADLRKSGTAPRITLPGPMLTRSLVSFTGREFTPIFLEARPFRKRFAYGWVAAVLAVGTVLGVGFSSMVSPPGRPPVEARAASDGTPSAAVESNPEARTPMNAPVQASGANPLSKMIEVTGFRVVLDPSRKPQVEYLVVNHSAARFPDATIYVSLSTANAHVGQAPLCRFSFAAPDLGPYEAKEMISAIEKTNRAINLPEWQDLRAEIEIGQ